MRLVAFRKRLFIENNKRGAGNGASFYEDTTDYERKSSDNSGDF